MSNINSLILELNKGEQMAYAGAVSPANQNRILSNPGARDLTMNTLTNAPAQYALAKPNFNYATQKAAANYNLVGPRQPAPMPTPMPVAQPAPVPQVQPAVRQPINSVVAGSLGRMQARMARPQGLSSFGGYSPLSRAA